MAENQPPKETPGKPTKSHSPAGVWVTFKDAPGGLTYSDITVHTSEIAALRLAMSSNKKAVYVPFNTSLDAAVSTLAT